MKASYLKVSASSERKKCFCKILEDLGFMPWGHMLSNTFLGQAAKFCNIWKTWNSNFLENLSKIKSV
jgi:hypothetical protein